MKIGFFLFLSFVSIQLVAVEVGIKAPNLVGKYLHPTDYKTALYSLSLDQDTIRVINLFWTECRPCQKEIPELAKLEREFPKADFILVNVFDEKPEIIKHFLSRLKDYPKKVIIASNIIRQRYKAKDIGDLVMPTTIIIGKNNIIQDVHYGYKKNLPKKLQAKLSLLLNSI